MIWPCLDGHISAVPGIQTYLSYHFHSAVDYPGLRRNGSSSQIIDQVQDFLEQFSWHRRLGQLECDIAAMADDFSSDFHQLLSQCRQRPILYLFGQSQSPHKVGEVVGQGKRERAAKAAPEPENAGRPASPPEKISCDFEKPSENSEISNPRTGLIDRSHGQIDPYGSFYPSAPVGAETETAKKRIKSEVKQSAL